MGSPTTKTTSSSIQQPETDHIAPSQSSSECGVIAVSSNMIPDTATFFTSGTSKQFDYVLKLYPAVLALKAAKRNKPDELIRLDNWYQNELPKLIKQRGKDAHMIHDELVQTMKWKQSRGKYYPQLSYLVKVNTPRAVVQETKKAFRKLPNLEQAITALSNLKGVGTTMASALLAAAAPERAPFMADECLMAIPDIEGIDYTTKEYLNFVQHISTTVKRLNADATTTAVVEASVKELKRKRASETDDSNSTNQHMEDNNGSSTGKKLRQNDEYNVVELGAKNDGTTTVDRKCSELNEGEDLMTSSSSTDEKTVIEKWSAHRVELALWTHYVATDLAPDLLIGMPDIDGTCKQEPTNSDERNGQNRNGGNNQSDHRDDDSVLIM